MSVRSLLSREVRNKYQVNPDEAVEDALANLRLADAAWQNAQVHTAHESLAQDPAFRALIHSIDTVENAANALATAMTYLRQYRSKKIGKKDIKERMVGHVGATTAISRTYVNFAAAMAHPDLAETIKDAGIDQCHVVTGPGHGAAAIFALLFLEGTLSKIYPAKYPLNAEGLQNLIEDFCRPGSPLPSHVSPWIPSVSEGGELGYSFGIAQGAGFANPDAAILAQIGDMESESGPLQACIENHNAIYDFRKGLVLPVLHANGMGISSPAIHSARTDDDMRSYLRGLGYAPMIVNAEDNDSARAAKDKAKKLDELQCQKAEAKRKSPSLDKEIASLRKEVRELRDQSAEITNAVLQELTQRGIKSLAEKKAIALELDKVEKQIEAMAPAAQDQLAERRLTKLERRADKLRTKLRKRRTPFIVYREDKGGGHAPAYVHGTPARGANIAHQVILSADALTAKDSATRELLEGWLLDLTDGKGPAGLLPNPGTELGEAMHTTMPEPEMTPGAAPLAVGNSKKKIEPISADTYLKPAAERGVELRGSNDLIDEYLRDYLTQNLGATFLLSADTAESNRLKKAIAALGRRFNLQKGEHHPKSSNEGGEAIDVLSEQFLMALAQGMVNSGKQPIISNYEAFFQVPASMIRQYLKFRKQAAEANAMAHRYGRASDFRPEVPNMVLHLSSLAFAQDHNGLSHQNPGLVDDLVSDPRDLVRVFMPPEANTAVLQTEAAVKGTGKVATIVADKQPRKQFLNKEEALELANVGGAVWDFASSGTEPDVILAASGGYHTDETLAAAQILFAFNEKLEKESKKTIDFRTVNIAEPFMLRAPEDQEDFVVQAMGVYSQTKPASCDQTVFDDETFERLFPKNVPIVYNFGGFKRTAKSLLHGRRPEASCHGYVNQGTTTTRFDMMRRNKCDRYTIVMDAMDHARKAHTVGAVTAKRVKDWCRQQRDAHERRMIAGEYVDPKSIAEEVWKRPSVD